jgi:hypothetical protein
MNNTQAEMCSALKLKYVHFVRDPKIKWKGQYVWGKKIPPHPHPAMQCEEGFLLITTPKVGVDSTSQHI